MARPKVYVQHLVACPEFRIFFADVTWGEVGNELDVRTIDDRGEELLALAVSLELVALGAGVVACGVVVVVVVDCVVDCWPSVDDGLVEGLVVV